MSPKQTSLYWRTWSALCTEFDWPHNSSARRYALHQEAGCPQSSKRWENPDFDRFLAHARALLAGRRTGGTGPVDEAGERRRLLWRIKQDLKRAGLDEHYVAQIATDMYGLGCWSLLALDHLTNLRNTIHNRTAKSAPAPRPARRYPTASSAPCIPVAPPLQAPIPVIAGAECPF